jgi:hypothetical protein
MPEYSTPLEERRRLAAYAADRYRRDEAYRLRKLNTARRWQGLEPYSSVEDIKDWSHGGRVAAARARRDERGRFL